MSTAYRFLGSSSLLLAPAALFLLAWPGLASAQEADVVIEHLAEPSTGSSAFYHPAEAPTVRVVTGGMLRTSADATHLASAKAEAWGLSAAAVGYEDLAALGDAVPEGPFLAANVRRAGKAPFAGHVIREVGGARVAFVGITAVPSHAADLIDLGAWEILDAEQALGDLVAELADRVDFFVLLAAMDRIECARLLRAVPGIDAALVASETVYDFAPLPVGTSHLITSPVASQSFARLSLRRDGTGWQPRSNSIVRVRLDASDEARIREVYAAGGEASEPSSLFAGTPSASESGFALPESIELGQDLALALSAGNRGADLCLSSMRLLSSYGGHEAPPGHTWLVLTGTWRNVIPLAFAFERELPVAYAIPNPRDHFYVVVDGCRLGRLDAELTGGPGGVAKGSLMLPRLGSERSGNLVFSLPVAEAPRSLELRFYDYAHGHLTLPLLAAEPPASEPTGAPRANRVLEMGIHAFETRDTIGSRSAPAGMTFAIVDLQATSRFTYESDATAFDPTAEAGDTMQIGTVADWKETDKYLQAVVDGEYAYGLEPETTLPGEPRFLPDTATGERAVFLVPEELTSLELRCDFPNAAPPSGGVFHPEPLLLPLEGERPPLPAREALRDIVDGDFVGVTITGQEARASFAGASAGADRQFLVLDVSVRCLGDQGQLFQTPQHLRYVAEDGSQISLDETSGRGLRRTVDVLYVPKGARRSFQAVFRIPASERKPRLAYRGVSMAEVYDLPPLTEVVAEAEPATDPVVEPPLDPEPPARTEEPLIDAERPPGLPSLAGVAIPGFTAVAQHGAGLELGVLDACVVEECLGRKAAKGMRLLQVQLVWRRLGPEERWRTGYISDAFFLLRAGTFIEHVWRSCWGQEGFLPSSIELDGEKDTLACTVVFEVPDDGSLGGSEIVFVPREKAPLRLPFVERTSPEAALPVLARAENELLELTAHEFVEPSPELVEQLGHHVSKGRELLCVRVSVAAKEGPVRLSDFPRHLQLVAEGSFPCPSFWSTGVRIQGWPMWRHELLVLPGVRDHAVLAFEVPRRDGALRLELHLPNAENADGEPLTDTRLALSLADGAMRSPAPVLARFEENGWEIEVLGLRTAGPRANGAVVMDVRVRTTHSGQKARFDRQDLHVVDQNDRRMGWVTQQGLPYEFRYRFLLNEGGERRFDVCIRLPDAGTYMWLKAPLLCPTSMVWLPNPWMPAEAARLATGEPLEVITAPKPEVAYSPPSFFPEPEPRGIEGVGLTGQQVNEAIRRGAQFLMKKHAEGFRHTKEEHILVILALLHSRELEKDPELLAKVIECVEQRPLGTIYDAAVTLMAAAWLDPERYRPRIEKIAQAIIEAQGEAGGWTYSEILVRAVEPDAPAAAEGEEAPAGRLEVQGGEPIPRWPGTDEVGTITLERQTPLGRTGGDNSCSQYAILALQSAFNAGVHAPPETWERAVKWFGEGGDRGRGWGYSRTGASTGSMTTAGLAGLSVSSFHLGERSGDVERKLATGVDWLARNFAVTGNPRNSGWHFYYLYGLERAGRLLGKEYFGPHEWYPLGARYLIDNQAAEGSWTGIGGHRSDILDTSFGLLFLTLATEKLGAEETVPTGPGRLTVLTPGSGGSVVFILDASGSMGADLGDESRFDTARRVVLEVLESADPGLEVALRVYGHRYRSIDERANQDSELVVGFGPPDRPELEAKLKSLRYRGKTPLTYSCQEALKDLAGASSEDLRVVLLTDGNESDRRAKPVAAAEALAAAGARLDVVGLAMDSTELLGRMAKAGGGALSAADDADQLLSAMRAAFVGSVPFRVTDAKGEQVAVGESGTEVELPAGPYAVTIDLPDGPETVEAWVHQDRMTRVIVRSR